MGAFLRQEQYLTENCITFGVTKADSFSDTLRDPQSSYARRGLFLHAVLGKRAQWSWEVFWFKFALSLHDVIVSTI